MPFPHVALGDPFRPSASRTNAFIDAANAHAESQSAIGPRKAFYPKRNPVVVWAENNTATDLPIFAVMGLGRAIFLPSGDGFETRPGFQLQEVAAQGEPFGILQEPINGKTAEGPFADVAISKEVLMMGGVSPARLLVRDAGHQFARPNIGDRTTLETCEAGPARILWKDTAGSIVWGYVLLGLQTGESDAGLKTEEYIVFDESYTLAGELLKAHVVRESIVGRFVNWASFRDVWGSQINQGVPLPGRRYKARRSRNAELVDGMAVYLTEECDCSSGSDGSGSSGSDGSSGSSGSGSSGSGSSGVTSCSGACGCGTMPSALELEIGGVVLATFSNTGLCEYTSDLPQFTPSCMVFQTSATFTCHCVSGAPAPILTFSNITGCTPTFNLNVVSCSPFRVEGTVDWADAPDEYGCSCDGTTQLVVIREI